MSYLKRHQLWLIQKWTPWYVRSSCLHMLPAETSFKSLVSKLGFWFRLWDQWEGIRRRLVMLTRQISCYYTLRMRNCSLCAHKETWLSGTMKVFCQTIPSLRERFVMPKLNRESWWQTRIRALLFMIWQHSSQLAPFLRLSPFLFLWQKWRLKEKSLCTFWAKTSSHRISTIKLKARSSADRPSLSVLTYLTTAKSWQWETITVRSTSYTTLWKTTRPNW